MNTPNRDDHGLKLQFVFTTTQAAKELGIGESTVRERIASGQLKSFKDGSRRLVARQDLLGYINNLREAA